MSDTEFDSIVENYFRQLETLLSPIPRDRREQLIYELREHVRQARAALPVESAAAIYEIFERIGSPEEIAREELSDQSLGRPLTGLRRLRDVLAGAPSMTERGWEWVGAASGLLFVLCFFASRFLVQDAPTVSAPAGAVAAYFNANPHSLVASGLLGTVAMLAFLIFVGVVRGAVLRASPDAVFPSSVLLAAGSVFAVVGMLAAVVTTTLAVLADQSPGNLAGASYLSALYLLRTVSGVGVLGLVAAVTIGVLTALLLAARFIGATAGLVFMAIGLVNAVGGGAALVMGSYSTAWAVVQTIATVGIGFVALSVCVVFAMRASAVSNAPTAHEAKGILGFLVPYPALRRRLGNAGPWLSGIALMSALAVAASIAAPLVSSGANAGLSLASASSLPPTSSSASVGADGSAICAPTTDAATSGGSPSALMASATQVASGTIEGKPWSLWSADGQTGAAGLEDGGVVFAGREYGLCPGYPNPSETEMIDTTGDAVIYGVVDYPGLATVQVSTGAIDSFAVGTVLPTPHVQVVNGVAFYIGTLPDSACSYSYFEINTTSASSSTEHNIGFGGSGTGQGYSITNNPGNAGACVAGKLDPLSYSQGIWQIPPGQFSNGSSPGSSASGTGSSSTSGNGGLVNQEDVCNPQATGSQSGQPASQLTSDETEVTSGTVGGRSWSLWVANDESGVTAIEQGGFVLGNLWYGMCPGTPNPAEFEMIDASPDGVVYGYVANPGGYAISLASSGQSLPTASTQQVDGGTFFVDLLSQSACSYPSLDLTATTSGVTDQHHFDFGTCTAGQLVEETGSYGSW